MMFRTKPVRGQRGRGSIAGLVATALCAASLMTVPAAAIAPAAVLAGPPDPPAPAMTPIDPQQVVQQSAMTWADYKAIPNTNWSDPSLVPTIKKWKVALVVTDVRDVPFAISQPAGSTVFGNPQSFAHDIPRASVPGFLRDWLNTPSALNNFQTMNGYWMADSFGQYGVQLDAFGPYRLNRNQAQFFLTEYAGTQYCPDQTMVSAAATNTLTIPVTDSSWFYVGDTLSIVPTSAGWSGTKWVMAIPDATHITISSTTLAAATGVGDTQARLASLAGMNVGDSVTIDVPLAVPETATIGAIGTGSGSTTFGHATAVGATNIKVSNISGFAAGNTIWLDSSPNIETATIASVGTAGATTLAAAAAVGATNIKVSSNAGFVAGQTITIDTGTGLEESRVITTVGSGGATGGGLTLTTALANAHATGAFVDGSGITLSAGLAKAHASGAAVSGSGVTFAAPLANAHASGRPIYDAAATGVTTVAAATTLAADAAAGATNVKVAATTGFAAGQTITIDAAGTPETKVISSVGSAGPTGSGLTLTNALGSAHATGATLTATGGFIHDCNGNFRSEAAAAWTADVGSAVVASYDNIFYVTSGQDESGTWQEFGEMKFQTQNDVTDAFGNPNPACPTGSRRATCRGPRGFPARPSGRTPRATPRSRARPRACRTYAHELSHNLGLPDNYNNPFGTPLQRTATGMWDMMSRGPFNGPGGPHTRWLDPAEHGRRARLAAQLAQDKRS